MPWWLRHAESGWFCLPVRLVSWMSFTFCFACIDVHLNGSLLWNGQRKHTCRRAQISLISPNQEHRHHQQRKPFHLKQPSAIYFSPPSSLVFLKRNSSSVVRPPQHTLLLPFNKQFDKSVATITKTLEFVTFPPSEDGFAPIRGTVQNNNLYY